MFKAKKANFVELRKEFQSNNEAFQSSIDAKISKLQKEPEMESKIMDALAIKEEKCKVLETNLCYTEKQVDDLLSERAVIRSCISDVTKMLFDIIEACDPRISITIKNNLLEKLRPVFAMLHRLEGFLKSGSFLQ
uniref:Uncharacterized protein n=1 Tax=Lactuca sativa TaxID=4236 RepID=A0A9R1XGC7_LACSA|nr:hypothetical protein LSAT_V11C400212250 [Lactuca sativa]